MVLIVLAGGVLAPPSAPSDRAAAPIEVVAVEPRNGQGAVVVERVAAARAGRPERWRLNLDLVLESPSTGSSLALNQVTISYGRSGPNPRTVAVRAVIEPGAQYVLNVPESRDLPFPVPSAVTVELRFGGYDPYTLTQPLTEYRSTAPGRSYPFPGRREDLPDGWYWTDEQNHVAGTDHRNTAHQRFAYDFTIRRWNGTRWTNLVQKGSSEANEDHLVWGMKLYAVADGTIVRCRRSQPDDVPATEDEFGNGLWIKTKGSAEHVLYAHLKRNSIERRHCPREGDGLSIPVRAGDYIGQVGNSGSAQGPHLHIEVYVNGAGGEATGRPMHFRDIRVRKVPKGWAGGGPCQKGSSDLDAVKAAAVDASMLVEPLYRPGHREIARHGVLDTCLQDLFAGITAAGYAPASLSGFDRAGKTYLNSIFRSATARWTARFGLTSAQYQSELEQAVAAGYRPSHVESYLRGGQVRYAFAAEKRSGPEFRAYHGRSTKQHDALFAELSGKGFTPVVVSVVAPRGIPRYTALWAKRSLGSWRLSSAVPGPEYQAWVEAEARAGRQLVCVDAYVRNGVPMFSTITSSTSTVSVARHGLTAAQYQAEYDAQLLRGRRTQAVTGYASGGGARYAALWG